MRRGLTAILIAGLLSACQMADDPSSRENPYAPTGVARSAKAPDSLIVGHRLMAAGEHELALKAFHRATADHGLTAEVLSSIGSANLRLGRLGQAERDLRRAVAEDPTYGPAWNNLGVTLMEAGKIGEAREIFEKAYAMDNGESDAIRDNLRLALAKFENDAYHDDNEKAEFALVSQGSGKYLLKSTP